jgi:hypothetical protein
MGFLIFLTLKIEELIFQMIKYLILLEFAADFHVQMSFFSLEAA